MNQVCFDASTQIAGLVTLLITIASGLANFVKTDTMAGKAVHFAALNFRVVKTAPIPATADNQNQPKG